MWTSPRSSVGRSARFATESRLEDLFLALLRRTGLDAGVEVNHRHDAAGRWVRTDARWPHARLVVELKGFGVHGDRAAFLDDADRELHLREADWDVLSFTWPQVRDQPARVARAVARGLTAGERAARERAARMRTTREHRAGAPGRR